MACNWHVITCHYMHYMPLHAIEDANGDPGAGAGGPVVWAQLLFMSSIKLSMLV